MPMLGFTLPMSVVVAAAVVGALLAAIAPTFLYLYVEPRCRRHWAAAGEASSARKAPALVRLTAWSSFAVGQLALPSLLVPASCAGLVYVQARLGLLRPGGLMVTVAVAVAALVQSLVAVRLIPLGVRLLARDAKLVAGASARARTSALVNGVVLAGGLALSWALATLPSFGLPWLRFVLAWAALRPVIAYAAVCLLHAMLLGRCARALAEER